MTILLNGFRKLMRVLLIAVGLPWVSFAQDAGQQAKDVQQRALDEERRVRQLERSISEQARIDAAKPPARNAQLCESSRINYQNWCGSPFTPRWRSPRCAEAEVLLRQNC